LSYIDEVEIKILVENTAQLGMKNILGAHGLAIHLKIRYDDGKITNILFDTGPSHKVIENNAEEMNVKLNEIDMIVLSHGHYDHTGGLLGVLKSLDRKIPIIAHPDCFLPKFVLKPKFRYNGIPFSTNEIQQYANLICLKEPIEISRQVYTSGEVPRITDFEKISGLKTIREHKIIDDKMLDDQSLIINFKDGLIIITGCAHAGVINIIERAIKITGREDIRAVIGGFHLVGAKRERIEKTIEALKSHKIKEIMPCHCTGEKAIIEMAFKLKEKIKRVSAGNTLIFK